MKQVTSTHKLIGFGGNIVQLAKQKACDREFRIQMQLYSHSFIRHDKSNSCLAICLVLMQILKVKRVNCEL